MERFGKIDVLVNNAGIALDIPLMEKTVEQWERTLRVNLIGAFLCSKYIGIEMKKQKSGVIVNVSSTNAHDGFATSVDYDASKAGMNIMTENLAIELAPHIRVNAVAPGWVDTDINKALPPEYVKEETEKVLLKRFGKPEEIANLIVFLASDEASYINGTVVTIDGGM
ncbi:MAG: 3-oxoacyl-[acyl-carrier-protein] reductase [Parcubacteria group bacterium GW2011_GWA2_46_7]|nr:MAG: 3-oxoacyl-[acyl-carrier-protein] reductase [Parcubacteria group bacterium GW2011_GWA1_45_7]KKU10749.1 MAG: 3-oxoacyl-[acyl-carrier-protein] reductase [Parcubacteria group bacterium GW2011_GWF1_45_5]KKU43634.1 MAG: 3-oxoacyl-[acyl-carrier-protein] reductase [Parcubacteria group bacterium GW2011_GWA2_46_7]